MNVLLWADNAEVSWGKMYSPTVELYKVTWTFLLTVLKKCPKIIVASFPPPGTSFRTLLACLVDIALVFNDIFYFALRPRGYSELIFFPPIILGKVIWTKATQPQITCTVRHQVVLDLSHLHEQSHYRQLKICIS